MVTLASLSSGNAYVSGVGGLIQCSQWLANATTFLRKELCFASSCNEADKGTSNLLHASTYYSKYSIKEDLFLI